MEIFKFLSWQWNRFHNDEKALIGMSFMGILSIILSLFYGFKLGGALALGAVIFFLTGAVIVIYSMLNKQWRQYKQHKEREAQQIMDRLRGY